MRVENPFRTGFLSIFSMPMKTIFKPVLLLVAAVLLSGCFRNDIRTETFQIEQLRNEEGARLVMQSLRGLPGIQEVRPSLENRTCTVVFNGRHIYLKNIEYAIVKAGFALPNWPAETADKSKLPKELQ